MIWRFSGVVMRRSVALFAMAALWCLSGTGAANAETCPGNPDALGTSRTMALDTTAGFEIGKQYGRTLPLGYKEVVLTFDDGPQPANTHRVLDMLAGDCVKATFFLVGRNASAYPDSVRRIARAGHSIGTHSMTHRLDIPKLPFEGGLAEVDNGFGAVRAALGADADPNRVAPFFRFPGLLHTKPLRENLAQRGIGIFGIDMEGGDWFHFFTPQHVLDRVMSQLNAEQRGVILLHDIQTRTVDMLPALLARLKAGGYKVVHIVPARDAPQLSAVASAQLIPAVSWARANNAMRSAQRGRRVPELNIPVVETALAFYGMAVLHPTGDRLGYTDLPARTFGWEGMEASLNAPELSINVEPRAPRKAAAAPQNRSDAAPTATFPTALRLGYDADTAGMMLAQRP